MKRILLSLVALGLFAVGCAQDTTAPASDHQGVGPQFASGGIVHRVSVGGSDFVGPGVDANFSLLAIEHANGRVHGNWSDQFGHGNGGLHIKIDCLHVVGNEAWLSGIGSGGGFENQRFATRVRDNPDQISFSVPIDAAFDCHTAPPFPLFDKPNGQVKVD